MVSRFRAARSLVRYRERPAIFVITWNDYHGFSVSEPYWQPTHDLVAMVGMSRETIEIDQAGPAKTCRLSRQVSGACDVWLKKRGLAIGREASTQMFRGQRKKKVALAEAEKARGENKPGAFPSRVA